LETSKRKPNSTETPPKSKSSTPKPHKARLVKGRYRIHLPKELVEQTGLHGEVCWMDMTVKDKTIVLTPAKEPSVS